FDGSTAVDDTLRIARLALRVLDPLRVRLRIREAEDIERLQVTAQLVETARIEKLLQPLPYRQPEVVVALGADAEVPAQPLVVDEGVAGRALGPLDLLGGPRRGDRLSQVSPRVDGDA